MRSSNPHPHTVSYKYPIALLLPHQPNHHEGRRLQLEARKSSTGISTLSGTHSCLQYDRKSFQGEQEHITAAGMVFTFLEPQLDAVTAKLSAGTTVSASSQTGANTLGTGHQAVCLFVNDDASAETLRILHSLGVKYIAMRSV